MTVFFFALCLATLFVQTFAPFCEEWLWEFDDFDCSWVEWSSWSSCSGGIKKRSRTMEDLSYHCRCDYEDQTGSCSVVIPRPIHGGWSAWFVSTSCSVTCGRGVEVLSRTCTNPAPKHGGRPCSGDARKNQVCVKQHCPINGGWSRWSAWSSCSHSCGTAGSRERSRSCTHPAPQHGGKVCAGAAKERQVCNRRHCPVDGGWSSWGAWTTCTKPCESGTQTRTRSCTRPRPRHGGKNCPGAAKEQRVCNTHSCPVDGGWSSWGGWASCSQSCGTGSQERSRSCTQPAPKYGGKSCPGAARENRLCNKQLCPVDGGWSSWGVWTTCTKPCESGTQARTRSCTQPPPKNGGETCPGAAMERRVCNTHSCPVHGGWSDWFVSTPCSVSCGSGIEVLSRTCTNPAPKHGGRRCQGNARKDQACAQKPCPVDGGWSDWTGWTSCSTSCGTGFRERSRSCTQPAPKFGGKTCPGAARESHGCNTHSCPVHGGWSGWSSWSPCGKTCGGGLRERTRSCTNPPPYYGGRGCGTHYYESKQCAMNTCPVDGGWSSWSGWSSCSKSCGTGFLERSRSCTQPAPSSGGKPCPGADKESSWCNSHACPVDGGWSAWSSWSSCGKTCGGGQRERTRSCTNPPPYYGGRGCGNHYHESKECAVNKCPVDGGWSEWGNWTECSVTCGIGVESRERKCDDPAPSAGGRPCQGYSRDVKSCNTTKICIDRVGCYGNFHSTFLGSFRDEIQWFAPPFSKQMQKMVDKCARLAVTKGLRYFAVENFGNCYGANDYSSGGEPTAFECNFGVGLENFFFIYKVST